jgi:phosphate transport system permease protein
MAQGATRAAPEPLAPALQVFSTRFARRKLFDRAARQVVTLGGVVIIGSILAILLVIAAEAYPLLRKANAVPHAPVQAALGASPLAVESDEYQSVAAVVTEAGLSVVSLAGEPSPRPMDLATLRGARVSSVSPAGRQPLALGLSDGRVLPIELSFAAGHGEGEHPVEVEAKVLTPIVADTRGRPIRLVAHAAQESAAVTAAVAEDRQVVVVRAEEQMSMLGQTTREEKRSVLDLPVQGTISAIAVDGRGDNLFVGTTAGEAVRVDLHPRELVASGVRQIASRPGAKITVLGFVLGDRTLVVGDDAGGVSTWQLLSRMDGEPELTHIHQFPRHPAPVTAFAPARRHKGFWTADAAGSLRFDYSTTAQTLLSLRTESPPAAIGFAPKANGLIALAPDGRLARWDVDCPHPEASVRALFGKLWYEGYDHPDYVWQSTGGTDDFEPKLSLTPLFFGTLKGTFYALLFAVPIALGAALYASQFMHPRLKAIVKPTVEIMAALPSVVLGFMAGLWLAPNVERVLPGLFLSPVVCACMVLVALGGWRSLPEAWRSRLRPGTELVLLVPAVLVGLWLSFSLGGWIERSWLGGDYRSWLNSLLGIHYDQRNSIVVGLAMGFAVIPVIFTIADDSLANVPPHLTAGSLALGATRWQTAVRVVLPSASPGIFSAIMIGFGRAVGETMIVLMATGNTPVMSLSAFNGFRALSANVAVELPEAPEGGTLFRVLFVAALLLFVMTFIVNTVAELVRLRLRQKYRTL